MAKLLIILAILLVFWEAKTDFQGGVMNYDESSPEVTRCNQFAQEIYDLQYFNCSNLDSWACRDRPCEIDSECSWQVHPNSRVILSPGYKYPLYKCQKCPTFNCNNKYAIPKDGECGPGGIYKTKTYGTSWYCVNPKCKGKMEKQGWGKYKCIDDTCTESFTQDYECKSNYCEAEGGQMFWDQTINKWNCISPTCLNVDAKMTKTSSYRWECKSPSCPGRMEREYEFGRYICVDPSCDGEVLYTNGKNPIYYCKTNLIPFSYLVKGFGLALLIIILKICCCKSKKLEEDLKNEEDFIDIYENNNRI